MNTVTVFAPGSIGNLGVGLDVLGLAVSGAGDWVTAEPLTTGGVELRDPGHADLPTDPAHHGATLAALAVLKRAQSGVGLALWVKKGLPLAGGQGGSAASAVAGAVAANEALGRPLGMRTLLEATLEAETTVAGRHADNVAPSLLGGAVLIRSVDTLDVVSLPVPQGLTVVLVHPAQQLRTADGRAALPDTASREVLIHQTAQVGAMVAALCSGDLGLLGRALDDRYAEAARAPLLPGFVAARLAALEAGALGAGLSGSGPTAFALLRDSDSAERVGRAMQEAYTNAGFTSNMRVASVDRHGARVVTSPGAFA